MLKHFVLVFHRNVLNFCKNNFFIWVSEPTGIYLVKLNTIRKTRTGSKTEPAKK